MGFLPAMKVMDLAASATNAGVSVWLEPDEITRVAIQTSYGDVTGTWKVEASNDPRARADHPDYSSSEWVDVTTDFGLTDPAGSASEEITPYANCDYAFIRVSYTHSAGTEYVYVWISGRSG